MSEPETDAEGETITLHELLERSAESALELQREDGSFPPGRNYTYDEPETPVRTTSHWTVTLSEVYDITGKEKFREAADAAVDYLLSDEVRPYGYTYYCRDAPGKDHCNGLVGQAGPIRALAHAGPILGRQDAIDTAEEVFMMHPFDEELGLWERVEVDGKKLSFDRTLNHQILFAAAGSLLSTSCQPIKNKIGKFLDKIDMNMSVHSDGLIKHYVRPHPSKAFGKILSAPRHYDLLINEVAYHYYSRSLERRTKERGYQTVNLVNLAEIKQTFGQHSFWNNDKINHSLEFLKKNQTELIDGKNTKHGSIMSGVAVAKILNKYNNKNYNELADLIGNDISNMLNENSYLLTFGKINQNDQSAIISTVVGLPNIQIKLS